MKRVVFSTCIAKEKEFLHKRMRNQSNFAFSWPRRVLFLAVLYLSCDVHAWQSSSIFCSQNQRYYLSKTELYKKRRIRNDGEDPDQWYEAVEADASPDDGKFFNSLLCNIRDSSSEVLIQLTLGPRDPLQVFWQEMERNRLLAEAETPGTSNVMEDLQMLANRQRSKTLSPPTVSRSNTRSLAQANAAFGMEVPANGAEPMNMKTVEATLAEYAAYAVEDNWLSDELLAAMTHNDDFFEFENGAKPLDEQLEEWEASEDHDDFDEDNTWMVSDEPWDHWAQTKDQNEKSEEERKKSILLDRKQLAREFLFEADDMSMENAKEHNEEDETEYLKRISQLRLSSRRLLTAAYNPKAKAFFGRPPDATEGFDRMWVSAIDNVCFKNLVGTFRNYGVQFADNFGDFQDGCTEDGFFSIEDVASFKARKVFEVTGLPCIASRTSFEIEPVPDFQNNNAASPLISRNTAIRNTRVMSGYRFNDVGMHVEYMCEALRSVSEPSRVTRFKTCMCYYDGEMEVFTYGVCDVDLVFADSTRTFIPVSIAVNEMVKTLELTFGLEYEKWIQGRMEESLNGYGTASVKLRDRVLKEGRVLPNDIVDVSSFMDSMVDVNLMDDCAKELSQRFVSQKPNKILTVATTGLVVAIPLAKYLQVPVVYARKERNVVMADTYQAGYSSKTVGKNRELLVAKSHLDEEDRVLIIDDFLSSGAVQEALLRIVYESGATAVGVGVLLEKVYESGRQSLSGFDLPVHSLCRIASVRDGVIQLVEEEGFDKM
jgi:xanthine phosphoribosyltransferase